MCEHAFRILLVAVILCGCAVKAAVKDARGGVPTTAVGSTSGNVPTTLARQAPAAAANMHQVTGDTFAVNHNIAVQIAPESGSVIFMLVDPRQSVLKLGDRFYVSSVLSQVFGPAAAPVLASLITNSAQIFGAPCDPYGRPGTFDCSISSSLSQAPVTPVSTAARAALVSRACEGIAILDPAVIFAAKQVTAVDVTQTAPATTDIAAIYGLFFPTRSPTDAEQAALVAVAQASLALPKALPISAWRHVLLAVCLSPRWQLY